MKKPNLKRYDSGKEAARKLCDMAKHIEQHDYVRWSLNVSVWEERWENPLPGDTTMVTQATFSNLPR